MAELAWALRPARQREGYPPAWPQAPARQLAQLLRDNRVVLRAARDALGPTFTLNLPGSPDHVYTCDPTLVQQVFGTPGDLLSAGASNRIFEPFMGAQSVLVLEGAAHRRQRQVLMPPLGPARLAAWGAAMVGAAERQAAPWAPGPARLAPEAQGVTLAIMLELVFGLVGDEAAALGAQLSAVVAAASRPSLWLASMQRDLGPLSPWGRFVRLRSRVRAALQGLIARRRRDGGGADLLSLLLAAVDDTGTGLGDDAVQDALITVLVTGHETSAMALCWVVHRLMAHDDARERVLDELAAAGGPLAPLPWLDAVIAETLRLHPVVPGVGRMVLAPFELGPWRLQPGRVLTCSTWLSHRDPAAWPEPERFDPTRFLGQRPAPGTWYPFGGGQRRCLGEHFARFELRLVLATWLRRWTFAPRGRPVRPERRGITIGPSDDLAVTLGRCALAGAPGGSD